MYLDLDRFVALVEERIRRPELKIPAGLCQQLVDMGGAAGKSIEKATRRWQQLEAARVQAEVVGVEAAIAVLEQKTPGKTRDRDLAAKLRKRERLLASLRPISEVEAGLRVYPFYFAPVVIELDGRRQLVPMRYRILPRNGVEVPGKYNVFNARRDSLQQARNWKPLFGNRHALFPFTRFFEWVPGPDGKPVEVSFSPDGFETMWAASLYEECQKEELIRSFAMVTDDPPLEVAEAGHDRCPVFLSKELVDDWLTPVGRSLDDLDAMLAHKEPTYYRHMALAA